MKLYTSFLILLFFTSCTFNNPITKSNSITADLQEKFKSKDISTTMYWSTGSEQDYIQVYFYNYKFGTQTHEEIDSLASLVRKRIIEKNPETSKLDYIEVRFTKEKEVEKMRSYMSFI